MAWPTFQMLQYKMARFVTSDSPLASIFPLEKWQESPWPERLALAVKVAEGKPEPNIWKGLVELFPRIPDEFKTAWIEALKLPLDNWPATIRSVYFRHRGILGPNDGFRRLIGELYVDRIEEPSTTFMESVGTHPLHLHLNSLVLRRVESEPAQLEAMFRGESLANLQRLELHRVTGVSGHLSRYFSSDRMPQLVELALVDCQLKREDLLYLLEALPQRNQIQSLDLSQNGHLRFDLQDLLRPDRLPAVQWLGLGHLNIPREKFERALVQAPKSLKTIYLGSTGLGKELGKLYHLPA